MRLKLLLAALPPMLLICPSSASAQSAAQSETGAIAPASVTSRPGEGASSGKGRILGAANAPVIVAEYSDLRCPDSARAAADYFPQIRREFLPQIRYEFRAFPLDSHPQAVEAAVAARCAGEQDKYLEFRTRLLSNLAPLTPETIPAMAAEVGIDPGLLKNCMTQEKHVQEVRQEKAAGEQLGVHATPTYVIFTRKGGGEPEKHAVVKNPKSFGEIKEAIEKAQASVKAAPGGTQ